jgi:UDP-N-acetylmuramyl tripeptide synthase
VESILQAAGMSVGVLGTVDYRFGDQRLPAPQTTPDPVSLQYILKQKHLEGASHVVMEVSSHAIDQHRVTRSGWLERNWQAPLLAGEE